jgi:chloramphenicol-sensitive protein RarD
VNTSAHHHSDDRAGVIYSVLAQLAWGVLPLYWRTLRGIPPFEIVVLRLFWCALAAAAFTAVRGNMGRTLAAARMPHILGMLLLTSLLISTNWMTFLYAVKTNQLVETSLGYYITPLVSFALGFAFFGEKMSRVRMVGLALGLVALAVQVLTIGHFPWIALTVSFSFGLYGFFRKRVPVAGLDGLLIESAMLFPVTLGLIGYWTLNGEGVYASGDIGLSRHVLIALSGPITAVPLALFAAGARRISMTTLGFLQYLSPTVTLTMAIFLFGEAFTTPDAVTFICVWAALGIIAYEGRFKTSRLDVALSER